MALTVGRGAHAFITTPGAGKWYRSPGGLAQQSVQMDVAPGGILEWFPQEAIIFNGARARMETRVALAADACFLGWEITCLGRRASGERFDAGVLNLATRFEREGRPLWVERGQLEGGGRLLQSPAGWAGFSVSASFHAVHARIDGACLAACRAVRPLEAGARFGVTRFPELLVARYLGHSAEAARNWCVTLWRCLRPALLEREGTLPRIWST
jgi:urease accessory protein